MALQKEELTTIEENVDKNTLVWVPFFQEQFQCQPQFAVLLHSFCLHFELRA